MSTQTTLPDEANSAGQEYDAEGFTFLGTNSAIYATVQPSGMPAATHNDNITYGHHDDHLAYAMALAGATGNAYLLEHAPYKYATEDLDPELTFAPVAGMEQHMADMNGQAYNPYLTKEPRYNVLNQPSTYDMVKTQAARGPDVLGSSDDAMLALKYEF